MAKLLNDRHVAMSMCHPRHHQQQGSGENGQVQRSYVISSVVQSSKKKKKGLGVGRSQEARALGFELNDHTMSSSEGKTTAEPKLGGQSGC